MKTKFYAIKNTQQIVTSWDECQKIVNGLSGAAFKSFKSEADAKAFLSETPADDIEVVNYSSEGLSGTITVAENIDPFGLDLKGAIYAVDGSFNANAKTYGAGVASYDDDHQLIATRRVPGSKPEFATAHNVAGETLAFATAITMAVEKMQNEITIICDYEGDFRWTAPKSIIVNNKPCWNNKQKTPIAAYHAKAIDYAKQHGLNKIHFVWVRGHKGIESNELVDDLAKEACGLI